MTRTAIRLLPAALLPLLLLAGASGALAQDAPLKVAVVDVERIVAGSTAGVQLQTRLNNFREQIEAELSAEAQKVAKLRTDAALASDPAEQARLAKAYEEGTIALQRMQDDKQREGQKMQDEGLRNIERTLAPVFQQIRDEQGYDLILALTPGIVLMVSERVDITQTVLDRYNAATQ